jgi:hypothetical protein
MRKADYLTLARSLRERVAVWSPSESPALGEMHEEYEKRRAASFEAASLARYLAEHLTVDKKAFLAACGLRQ